MWPVDASGSTLGSSIVIVFSFNDDPCVRQKEEKESPAPESGRFEGVYVGRLLLSEVRKTGFLKDLKLIPRCQGGTPIANMGFRAYIEGILFLTAGVAEHSEEMDMLCDLYGLCGKF